MVEELEPKLDLARNHAQERLQKFPEEIAVELHKRGAVAGVLVQAFMQTDIGRVNVEKVLPEDEADSIQWEGGAEHKGDEPGDADAKTATEVAQDAAQEVADSNAVETKDEENNDDF